MTLVVETPKPLMRANYVIVLSRNRNSLAIKVTVVISSQTCVSQPHHESTHIVGVDPRRADDGVPAGERLVSFLCFSSYFLIDVLVK